MQARISKPFCAICAMTKRSNSSPPPALKAKRRPRMRSGKGLCSKSPSSMKTTALSLSWDFSGKESRKKRGCANSSTPKTASPFCGAKTPKTTPSKKSIRPTIRKRSSPSPLFQCATPGYPRALPRPDQSRSHAHAQ